MPVIKSKPPEPLDQPPALRNLLNQLVEELRSPRDRGQPLILEKSIGGTDDFNVYVIWDRWSILPHRVRDDMIREAYFQLDGASQKKIPIASGVTTTEAISMGLLPMRIEPSERRDERFTIEELRSAMAEEGAVESTDGLQLRFPTWEQAEEAYARLNGRFPGCFRFLEEVFYSDQ